MREYVNQRDTVFKFKDGKNDEILAAIKKVVNEGKVTSCAGRTTLNKKIINDAKVFQDALYECGWEYGLYRNIPYMYFDGERIGDDYKLLCALAPFVEDGSYIEMFDEEGLLWRWIFKEGKCYDVEPKIIWEV